VPIPKSIAYFAGVLALVAGSVPRSAVWAADSKGFALLPPAEVTVLDPGPTPETCGEEPVPSSAQASRSNPEPLRHLLRYEDLPDLGAGDVVFVDVGRAERFQDLRIPGAIHVPLHALKTKGFLRTKRLILYNEASAPELLLETACRELEDAGFASVTVLRGGLAGWYGRGAPLEGPGEHVVADFTVPPWVADVTPSSDAFVWVGLALPATSDGPGLTVAHLLHGLEGAAAFRETWLGLLAAHPGDAPLLLIDSNGSDYARVERLLEAQPGLRQGRAVLYLEGGLAGYQAHLASRSVAHTGPARQTGTSCGSCP